MVGKPLSAPVKNDDRYRTVASVLVLFVPVDDVGGGGGNLLWPVMSRRGEGVRHTQRLCYLN